MCLRLLVIVTTSSLYNNDCFILAFQISHLEHCPLFCHLVNLTLCGFEIHVKGYKLMRLHVLKQHLIKGPLGVFSLNDGQQRIVHDLFGVRGTDSFSCHLDHLLLNL